LLMKSVERLMRHGILVTLSNRGVNSVTQVGRLVWPSMRQQLCG